MQHTFDSAVQVIDSVRAKKALACIKELRLMFIEGGPPEYGFM